MWRSEISEDHNQEREQCSGDGGSTVNLRMDLYYYYIWLGTYFRSLSGADINKKENQQFVSCHINVVRWAGCQKIGQKAANETTLCLPRLKDSSVLVRFLAYHHLIVSSSRKYRHCQYIHRSQGWTGLREDINSNVFFRATWSSFLDVSEWMVAHCF